jgi:polar amino acid transport system substrate-binding protein
MRLLIALLLLISALPVTAQDDGPEDDLLDVLAGLRAPLPDLDGQVIRVATMNTYPPFNQIQSDGTATGWDYDMLGALCERLNCAPQFVEIEWEGLIPSVSDGVNDMAANGITITEPRREIIDYSDPYITLEQVLVVRANDDRFTTVDEFIANDGLMLMALVDSTNEDAARDLLGAESDRIQTSDGDFDSIVLSLINAEVDAVVMDDLAAQRFVRDFPDALRIINDPITEPEQLALIFTPGSDLVGPFNAALDDLRADGTLQTINDRWFLGEED